MTRSSKKQLRHQALLDLLREDPFLTDEELAQHFSVSVPTVRLDRIALGISEQKERVRRVAAENYGKLTALKAGEIVGELVDLVPGESAMSLLETDESMVFEHSKVVRGQYFYAMAETLSIAAINANSAIVKIANIKYKNEVYASARLIAKAQVKRQCGPDFTVWVFIYENHKEVFRGKFILTPCAGTTNLGE